jgi:VIT1/CCC1 family predicted Fe2+/Mn2+ transporter
MTLVVTLRPLQPEPVHLLFGSRRHPRLGPESIREIVFGVEDGVVQNMTLIAGMIGAALSNTVIVLAGSINAMAGVLSMSVGTYLSSQAERDAIAAADPDHDGNCRSPGRDAAVMAVAYALGALAPLAPFMLGFMGRAAAAVTAVMLALGLLFWLGVVKAQVSNQPRLRSGLQLLALASAAGIAGFLLGVAAQAVFGLET